MPPKRKRNTSPESRGLPTGEKLKRDRLAGNDFSAWGWVGTEATDASQITQAHLLAACGLSSNRRMNLCANKYAAKRKPSSPVPKLEHSTVNGELDDDVIVISDDEATSCSKKSCKKKPDCLNYLGQDKWEDEEIGRELFMKAVGLGDNPILETREPGLPIGLKNLGATCYANAFLQVWFQDLAFRNGVYRCQPSTNDAQKFEESPIFQLQVTFAALHKSTQNVFNPVKLVESLKLRASEQQDAQEFGKLFMEHLDMEFQKQSAPTLKSLISEQFQGRQIYGTRCHKCQNRSERVTDFRELEISLENNSKLEERITTLLAEETLSGDNKYFCSVCDDLQDATRYSRLDRLPPVLHLSLLRFVFDLSSMERKKSKHSVTFPLTLDMGQFVGKSSSYSTQTNNNAGASRPSDNKYRLRGVLLHKGPSAYHGHYEAQVFDLATQSWYQFNDETVTKIKTLGAQQARITVKGDGPKPKPNGKPRTAKKPRFDSDTDVVEVSPAESESAKANQVKEGYVTSKDAYMLIYAKTSTVSGPSGATTADIELPTHRAWEIVKEMDMEHEKACEAYTVQEQEFKNRFDDLRQRMMGIYRSWTILGPEESLVVSRQGLETWLARPLNEARPDIEAGDAQSILSLDDATLAESQDGAGSSRFLPNSDIVCEHGRLDYRKASNMKRISSDAYRRIKSETNCRFVPELSTEDICRTCVEEAFSERLYQIQHPQYVQRFDAACDNSIDLDNPVYWISKQWLKDWRLVKPKMHLPTGVDPAPDAPDFRSHVVCEHACLSSNALTRRRISREASDILQELFPSWRPLTTDDEPCAVCEAEITISKEDKRDLRRKVEDEKARLKYMHEGDLFNRNALVKGQSYAMIPTSFVRAWKQWLLRPTELPRPDRVDTEIILCCHDKLLWDPKDDAQLDTWVAIIPRTDWDTLVQLYPCGQLLSLSAPTEAKNQDKPLTLVEHDIPVCLDCRLSRQLNYDSTELTIRLARTSLGSTNNKNGTLVGNLMQPKSTANGSRQSRRLQMVREQGERRKIPITKETTVREVKIALSKELQIPTISQRLFLRGTELEDSSATMSALKVLANDVMDLQEVAEDVDALDSDVDESNPAKKRRRSEGPAFGGTLLSSVASSDPSIEALNDSIASSGRACAACTFENPLDAPSCLMCESSFS